MLGGGIMFDWHNLQRFDDGVSENSIYRDLFRKYKITNVVDDVAARSWLVSALKFDLDKRLANYRAYIEPGMDARRLFELRKSMIIPTGERLADFYGRSIRCKTVEGVIKERVDLLFQFYMDYADLPWQYFLVMRHIYGKDYMEGFEFDFEVCFKDGDRKKQTRPDQYIDDFVREHMPYKGLQIFWG